MLVAGPAPSIFAAALPLGTRAVRTALVVLGRFHPAIAADAVVSAVILGFSTVAVLAAAFALLLAFVVLAAPRLVGGVRTRDGGGRRRMAEARAVLAAFSAVHVAGAARAVLAAAVAVGTGSVHIALRLMRFRFRGREGHRIVRLTDRSGPAVAVDAAAIVRVSGAFVVVFARIIIGAGVLCGTRSGVIPAFSRPLDAMSEAVLLGVAAPAILAAAGMILIFARIVHAAHMTIRVGDKRWVGSWTAGRRGTRSSTGLNRWRYCLSSNNFRRLPAIPFVGGWPSTRPERGCRSWSTGRPARW
mmetsp:Transcript_55225/g.165472  ORF Transcript_55225/g.165472 Transcript_55225/m.165472 type:complete len:301 (-) Transcript_55225:1253-2155(-)